MRDELQMQDKPIAPRAPSAYGAPLIAPPALESSARERMRRRRVRGRPNDEWAWVIIAAALLGVIVIVGTSLFIFVRATRPQDNASSGMVAQQLGDPALPTPQDARTPVASTLNTGQQVTLDDGRNIVLTPWDGKSRFTILLMGIDRRPEEKGLTDRTDSIMLASINPTNQTIGLLSVPRDLFVQIPGYAQLQRINSALVLGELQQTGYGPRLAMQSVQLNLGMRVNDYLIVDFQAFTKFVDTIGGIDVETNYLIDDQLYPNMYYGYDPFYLSAGKHHLDGATALKFARSRHGSSDLERAMRQQQVVQSVRKRVLDANMLPQLIVKAPSLWKDFSQNTYTGLSMDQVIQLAWYVKDIPSSNIKTGVIDERYTFNYTTSEGAQVLVPDRRSLGQLMVEVFGADYSR